MILTKHSILYLIVSRVHSTESGSGQPGPGYWQNRGDYKLSARLNEIDNSIEGNEEIIYTNNSPDNLSFVWLQLETE